MKRIALAQIASQGGVEFARLLADGKVGLRDMWMAAHGATRYAAAMAMGDIASDLDIDIRRGCCRACPSMVVERSDNAEGESAWCGKPFKDYTTDAKRPTCGCLLAGKTAVASERCPQGRWGAVVPEGGDDDGSAQ